MDAVNREMLIAKIVEATEKNALFWTKRVLSISFSIQKNIWTAATADGHFSFECCEEDKRVKVFSMDGGCLVLIDSEFAEIFKAIQTQDAPVDDHSVLASLEEMLKDT